MSCKCQQPKKIKNSAGGVDFYVCAKSQGGCGEEIGVGKVVTGSKARIYMNGQLVGEFGEPEKSSTDHMVDAIRYTMNRQAGYNVNPHLPPLPKTEECPACHGAGWYAKLYPNGHTEESCDYCDGIGEVEL